MGWIQTENEHQVAFSDAEMDETVEWSDNHTANVSAELEEYLIEAYDSISSVDEDETSSDQQ
ncbi:hypothetical protein C484_10616 [Natrialba taiwanensis DSM 12281]|uniref:Uncharacterized protein n=2 Tax=Natrialba taiwanensis TaxID=160846 RepID=L9ZYT2_9EURY|nr:hypothetical protein C484_10616 [Natrialba taiwanensis DSM 12281]